PDQPDVWPGAGSAARRPLERPRPDRTAPALAADRGWRGAVAGGESTAAGRAHPALPGWPVVPRRAPGGSDRAGRDAYPPAQHLPEAGRADRGRLDVRDAPTPRPPG